MDCEVFLCNEKLLSAFTEGNQYVESLVQTLPSHFLHLMAQNTEDGSGFERKTDMCTHLNVCSTANLILRNGHLTVRS